MTTFQILNQFTWDIHIIHEPEGFEFILPPGEEVSIQVESILDTICLTCALEGTEYILNVKNEKSLYKVYHKGVDVFSQFMK